MLTKTVEMPGPTKTVTKTVEVPGPTKTVTESPSSLPPAIAQSQIPDAPTGSPVDQEAVLMHAGWVVRDIGTADQRVASGDPSGLDTTMSFLHDDFTDLQDDGTPPGIDPANYMAKLTTLASFSDQASAEFTAGQTMQAEARYTVIRQHAGEILASINSAYGTNLKPP